MTQEAEAIKELMEQYEINRAEWVKKFGTDEGFNEWFTRQARR